MSDSACGSETTHPVIRLADAIWDVCDSANELAHRVEGLDRSITVQHANVGLDDAIPVFETPQQARNRHEEAKANFRATIGTAIAAIPGIDQYVAPIAKTQPGEWTSGLKAELIGLRDAGTYMEHCRDQMQPFLNELHGRRSFLLKLDCSALDKEQETHNEMSKVAALLARLTRKKKGHSDPHLRAWTQDDLDETIREYKAKRASSYRDLVAAVRANKPGAKKDAQRLYGRNAIARALGVKSPHMVSKSSAWDQIANDLGFRLNRGKIMGTRHTRRPCKIGLDMAIEQQSQRADGEDDHRRADGQLEDEERQETLRQISRLANAGKKPEDRVKNREAAQQLLSRLESGENTDDEARKVVEMILNP